MRLFTGIELPESIVEHLGRLLTHLRPTAHLKWSPVYNLHITTKFIGEWPREKLEEVNAALRKVSPRLRIPISIEGLGWFPNPHQPRVFWAGVHGGAALLELARETDEALASLGIPRETREYSPHLTLARIGQPIPLQTLRQAIAQLESVQFGTFEAECFHLYLSKPGAAGTVYTKLTEFRFAE